MNDLVNTLDEAERVTINEIMQSSFLPANVFEKYCSWSDDCYTRNCIVNNEKFELILLCWQPGQITPIHDHGGQECWVKVIQGSFKENIYTLDHSGELILKESTIASVNDCTYMDDHIGYHSLENVSKGKSMSLHLYSKPIQTCNLYDSETRKFMSKEMVYDTIFDS